MSPHEERLTPASRVVVLVSGLVVLGLAIAGVIAYDQRVASFASAPSMDVMFGHISSVMTITGTAFAAVHMFMCAGSGTRPSLAVYIAAAILGVVPLFVRP
ncbi:hypothetical protein [Streptosporangium roseum]|uniref:hypothetical protein n=1 Tax=Streptosporangium roseum TaxID=2001 RepID=UPI00331E1334